MATMKSAILVLNNPNAPRLCPELAEEIGLTESVILLQIEFWIRTSTTEEHDGKLWTYQSTRDIQKFFPFWGVGTISRAVNHLEELKLVTIGNFNKAKYDRTQWFAIDPTGFSSLKSIRLVTGVFQFGTGVFQSGTTIPENTTREYSDSTAKPAVTISGGSGLSVTPKSILDSGDDKPQRGKKIIPRTPLAKYLAENSSYGRAHWDGFATAALRNEWEKLEREQYDDLKGAIEWATKKMRFSKSILVDRIITATHNKKMDARKETPKEVTFSKDGGFYI